MKKFFKRYGRFFVYPFLVFAIGLMAFFCYDRLALLGPMNSWSDVTWTAADLGLGIGIFSYLVWMFSDFVLFDIRRWRSNRKSKKEV